LGKTKGPLVLISIWWKIFGLKVTILVHCSVSATGKGQWVISLILRRSYVDARLSKRSFHSPQCSNLSAIDRLIGASSPALARSWGGLCGVGHPGFVAFAAVAKAITEPESFAPFW
jgi:hypothetical protein